MRNKEQRRFTISELKEFDGKEGRPAYVAFKGKIYDVSNSSLWPDGKHTGRHYAGDDLTEGIINAPHGEEVFMKFPIVGELAKEEFLRPKFVQRIERLHLHPVLVHFSIAYAIVVPLFVLLYVSTGQVLFEMISYYMLLLGFLASPVAGFSGLFSWKVTYEGRASKIFAWKIIFTVVLIVVITACFGLRTLNPNILLTTTYLSYIYLALIMSLVPIVTILGHYGGKIVYS